MVHTAAYPPVAWSEEEDDILLSLYKAVSVAPLQSIEQWKKLHRVCEEKLGLATGTTKPEIYISVDFCF